MWFLLQFLYQHSHTFNPIFTQPDVGSGLILFSQSVRYCSKTLSFEYRKVFSGDQRHHLRSPLCPSSGIPRFCIRRMFSKVWALTSNWAVGLPRRFYLAFECYPLSYTVVSKMISLSLSNVRTNISMHFLCIASPPILFSLRINTSQTLMARLWCCIKVAVSESLYA
jgi:hypothetical protein